MNARFQPTASDNIDLLRDVTEWANGQREDYWHPEPGKAVPFADVVGVYLAVVRYLGSTIEEVIGDLPHPWKSYNSEDQEAINYVRAVFGMKPRR